MEQSELDLLEILAILRRRLWMIGLLPVVAAVTAALVSLFVLKPVYSASTTMWVIKDGANAQLNLNDVMLSRNLTKTYAEVAQSRAVLGEVEKEIHTKGITVASLQRKLTVTPVRDTEILSFSIEDENPAMAAKLADAVANSFRAQILSFMKVENVAVVDPAVVPTGPVRPRTSLNVAVALVLGLALAVGLAFLLEYLDTSIKTPEDLVRRVGMPVLGTIPLFEPDEASAAPRRSARKAQAVAQK